MVYQIPIYERLGDLKRVFQLVFQEIVKDEKDRSYRIPELKIFNGNISFPLQKYLERIFKFVNCSGSCFIVAIILIERIRKTLPKFRITSKNVHKIFMCSIVVAIKAYQDKYYKQQFYAKIAGIDRSQLNDLQVQFMRLIKHRALVSDDQFLQYVQKFESFYEKNFGIIEQMKKNQELEQEKQRHRFVKEITQQ